MCSQHNSMTEMCRALFKYEKKFKLVDIIELQLGISLKLDRV